MKVTREKAAAHRAAIVKAAADLFRARGLDGVGVAEIMQAAGLTHGGFYGHFESKEQLFIATMKHAAGEMWNKLLQISPDSSPRERVLHVLGRYLSRRHRDAPEAGCILPNIAAEVARQGEPYSSALAQELSHFVRSLAEILGGGPGSRETALGLIALMYGALSLSRALAGTALSDEFLAAAKRLGTLVVTDVP